MKNSQRLIVLLGLLFVMQARADTPEEVGIILDAFHRAAAESKFEDYVALMSDQMVFLGTDGTERWQGQAFRDFARPYFDSGEGWTYIAGERHVTLSPDGQIAWFDEALENAKLGRCRGSGVLVKRDDQWRIAQYNLSIPVPNSLAEGLVAGIAGLENGSATRIGIAPDGDVTVDQSPVATDATETPEAEEAEGVNCRRKRHKTNRPAGC